MDIDKYIESFDNHLEQRSNNLVATIRQRKPKLKISKVPEDLRTVQIKLNMPVMTQDQSDVEYYLQYNFDWSLNEQHISPREFISLLCESLNIPAKYNSNLAKQLCFQLIEYIEKHSYECDEPEPLEFRCNPEKRKPGRPVKNKLNPIQQPPLQQTPIKTTARLSLKQNLNCPNCQFMNTQAGYECKQCRLPFQLLESLNLTDPVVQVCVNLYELILQRVGSLSFLARNRKVSNNINTSKLIKDDFNSLYTLRERIKEAINPEFNSTVDNLICQILKNNGPLMIERSNLLHRRTRLQKTEQSEQVPISESSEDSESKQSFDPSKKDKY